MGKKIIIIIVFVAVVLLALGAFWYLYKDTYYYNSAIKTSNPSTCLKISSELKESVCLSNIAINTKDLSFCDKSPRMYIMTCYRYFAEHGGDILRCQDASTQVDEYNCYIAFADAKKSVSVCDNLTGDEKDYCYQGVAIVTNNVAICDTLPESSPYKETCARDVAQQNP
jgi:hypothetical protein